MRCATAYICVLALPSAIAVAKPLRAVEVQMRIIGSFDGFLSTIPLAINNGGQVVGYVSPTGTTARSHAFIWSERAGFRVLVEDAVATDVNERGDVSGYRLECTTFPDGSSSCTPRGFIWNERTGLTELGDLTPNAINDRSDVAGSCVTPTGDTLAACAIIRGVRMDWRCEIDECVQVATGINARGDVVGWRSSPDLAEEEQAMLFRRDAEPTILGAQTAEDINNAGIIAGRAPSSVWPSNATLWTRHGVIQAPSASTTVAFSLNSRGSAVGVRFAGIEGNAAFYWDGRSDTLLFLAPTARLSEATAINDQNEVVGFVDRGNFRKEFVIWRVR